MWTVLLCCALLLVHTTTAELKYFVTSPPIFKSNRTAMICIEVIGISEPTNLTVTLQIPILPNFAIISYYSSILPAGEPFWDCSERPIPSVPSATLASLTVMVGNLTEQRNVVVRGVDPICIGQMEKQIYKPKETMRCRITCLDADLLPAPQPVLTFEVQDPAGNILMRETNVSMKSTFAMFSFPISSEPAYGFYTTRAIFASQTVVLSFEIKRYVLPTFDAFLSAPQSVSYITDTMTISVSARYTFGENVGARVDVSVCRNPFQFSSSETCNLNPNGICGLYTGYLQPNGSYNVEVDLQRFQLTHRGLPDQMNIEATITENGTGVQVFKSASVFVTRQMPTPYFNYQVTDNCYRQGLNVTGSLILQDGNNKGIPEQNITFYRSFNYVGYCVTDEKGYCNFSLDTSTYTAGSITLEARYDQNRQCFESSQSQFFRGQSSSIYPQITIPRCFSRTGSFLKVWPVEGEQRCGGFVNIQVECILNRTSLPPDTTSVIATFKVIARTEIKVTGQGKIALDADGKGSWDFVINADLYLAPIAWVVVTIMLPDEVVGHYTTVQVQRCFQNKVNVTFEPQKVRPGSNVSITVEAAPGSHCAFCTKDSSVDILSPNSGLSWRDQVFNQLPYRQVSGTFVGGFSLASNQFFGCTNMPEIVAGGVIYEASTDGNNSPDWKDDVLNEFGFIIMCGCAQKPNVCPKPDNCPLTSSTTASPIPFDNAFSSSRSGPGNLVIESVRQFFPESWLCNMVEVNSDGKAVMTEKVPDSITKWVADVPCNSNTSGFGVPDTPPGLTVFQPFFVVLTLAAALVRGEECVLKATAFTYLPDCRRVTLTLAPSNDFTAQLISVENERCICENERTTASWLFSPLSLGTINIRVTAETIADDTCSGGSSTVQYRDTVIKDMAVFAEGLPRLMTQGALICSRDGPVSQSVNINLPPDVVNGSARLIVACVGDPIGISAQYLEDLVEMPTQCGEQTISKLRASLLVRKYLTVIDGLDQALQEKSDYNIANGVQNSLKFYSSLGCFKTWPNSACSLWLTCLGLVTLTSADVYTFVDPNMLVNIPNWIVTQQDSVTSAFRTDGNSYNKILESDVVLTAFVVICLLESGHGDSVAVSRALDFLRPQVDSLDTPLKMVMVCYAFLLANDTAVSNRLLERVKTFEITDGPGRHLTDPSDETASVFYCSSVEILQNAYYALCKLRSGADLNTLIEILRFLGTQMNGHGGFCSSQDTAPALQAMTGLQALIYTRNGTNTVTVQSGNNNIAQFNINPSNSLVLQQTDTLPLPGTYGIEVSGSGCVLTQTIVKYNVKLDNLVQTFHVQANISPGTCENGGQKKLALNISMSYQGRSSASNMAMVDVQLLSGFQPLESNLTEMVNQGRINEYDLSTAGHVMFYINRITNETTYVAFTMTEITAVQKWKNPVVLVYDYYQRDEVGSAEYAHPCSQSASEA